MHSTSVSACIPTTHRVILRRQLRCQRRVRTTRRGNQRVASARAPAQAHHLGSDGPRSRIATSAHRARRDPCRLRCSRSTCPSRSCSPPCLRTATGWRGSRAEGMAVLTAVLGTGVSRQGRAPVQRRIGLQHPADERGRAHTRRRLPADQVTRAVFHGDLMK